MEAPFACATTAFGHGYLVTVAGEVDIATAPQLAEILANAANGGDVRVDISAVTFLDSSGLQALVAAHRYITRSGRRMIVCGPLDPLVHRTLEITGLRELFDIENAPVSS